MRRSKTEEAVDKIIKDAVEDDLISVDLTSPSSTSCLVYEIQEELASVRQKYVIKII